MLLAALLLSISQAATAPLPDSYSFGIFSPTSNPKTSPPIWSSNFPASQATCGQPKSPGAGTTITISSAGVTAVWDDPADITKDCQSPKLFPPISLFPCSAAPCPIYQGFLRAEAWSVASQNPLTVSLQDLSACSTTGAEVVSVFVTRWELTTGVPGSRMRLNYQLASKSPVREIQAKMDGKTVSTVSGTDLTGDGGIWFITPASGTHKLSVWARNDYGCTKETFAPVDLVVK